MVLALREVMPRFVPIRQLLAIALAIGAASCAADEECGLGNPCVDVGLGEDHAPNGPGDTEINGPGQQQGGQGPGYLDQDGDGFTPRGGDCDDFDADVHPDAREWCDEIDNDCDGWIDDGLGRTDVSESDYGADGVPDYWSYTTYTSSGTLWFREWDTDADTVIDDMESYEYFYDSLNRLYLTETDYWMDGSVDETKEYFYDAMGRLERTEEDYGPDGDLDRIDTYWYDETSGMRVQWDMDIDGDLLVDTQYNYVYDANNQLDMLIMERYNDDMVVTSTTIYGYHYDPSGMIQRVDIDLTGDGLYDNTTEYVYDALGRMQEALTDVGRDLTIDSLTEYVYDNVTGDLIKIEMDSDNDGVLDTRINRWEECSDAENWIP